MDSLPVLKNLCTIVRVKIGVVVGWFVLFFGFFFYSISVPFLMIFSGLLLRTVAQRLSIKEPYSAK